MAKSAAWQRKEGKSPTGGLNAKGRASAKKQGMNLKPPQPEGGSRKDSFCARMEGMKKKLTSAKTAKDPDSRIKKAYGLGSADMTEQHDNVKNILDAVAIFTTVGTFFEVLAPVFGFIGAVVGLMRIIEMATGKSFSELFRKKDK